MELKMESVGSAKIGIPEFSPRTIESNQQAIEPALAIISNLSPEQTLAVLKMKDKSNSQIEKQESTSLDLNKINESIDGLREGLSHECSEIEIRTKVSKISEILQKLILVDKEQKLDSKTFEALVSLFELCESKKFPLPISQLDSLLKYIEKSSNPNSSNESYVKLKKTVTRLTEKRTEWEKSIKERLGKFNELADRIEQFLNKSTDVICAKEFAGFRSDLTDIVREFETVFQKILNSPESQKLIERKLGNFNKEIDTAEHPLNNDALSVVGDILNSADENRFFELPYNKNVCDRIVILTDLITQKFMSANDQSALITQDHKNEHWLKIYFPFLIKGCFVDPICKILSKNSTLTNALAFNEWQENLKRLSEQWKDIESFDAIEAERKQIREEMHQNMLQNQMASLDFVDELLPNKKKLSPNLQKFDNLIWGGGAFIKSFTNSRDKTLDKILEHGNQALVILEYFAMAEKNPQEIEMIELLQLVANKKGLPAPLSYPSKANSNSSNASTNNRVSQSSIKMKESGNTRKSVRFPEKLLIEDGSKKANEYEVCKELSLCLLCIAILAVGVAISTFNPEA